MATGSMTSLDGLPVRRTRRYDIYMPVRRPLLQISPHRLADVTPRPARSPQPSPPVKETEAVEPSIISAPERLHRTKLSVLYTGFAVLVLAIGLFVSFTGWHTNRTAQAAASQLTRQANNSSSQNSAASNPAPSTTKPSSGAVANYAVGPTLPRYLDIPLLGVHARVLSLGILPSGALAAPNNVFDTGRYNESALPGQPGAMLIDGHVSSWKAKGVFYGIKNLKPGTQLQLTRGDGTKFSYRVVTSKTYNDTEVNMQEALTPITAGKPGLNLITCTGQVKPGTSEFNQRVVVFAEQI